MDTTDERLAIVVLAEHREADLVADLEGDAADVAVGGHFGSGNASGFAPPIRHLYTPTFSPAR